MKSPNQDTKGPCSLSHLVFPTISWAIRPSPARNLAEERAFQRDSKNCQEKFKCSSQENSFKIWRGVYKADPEPARSSQSLGSVGKWRPKKEENCPEYANHFKVYRPSYNKLRWIRLKLAQESSPQCCSICSGKILTVKLLNNWWTLFIKIISGNWSCRKDMGEPICPRKIRSVLRVQLTVTTVDGVNCLALS